MDIAVLIIIAVYFSLHIIFYYGLMRSDGIQQNSSDRLPFISVIVAARNEESNIGVCINSLKNIVYPKEKYEVILVNDKSTDSTKNVMLQSTKYHNEFQILDTFDAPKSKLTGKVKALSYGISKSKGELIMMTDADCTVNKNWLTESAKYYNSNTGLLCGFTMIDYTRGLFSKLQSLDWIYLQSLASASSGINAELSCIGNNLSVSADAYNSVGGYDGLKFSVTEDLALLRKIKSEKRFKVLYPLNPSCLVQTLPCADFKELYRQKKRWFRGGTDINSLGYLLGFLLYASNLILLFGILFLSPLTYLIFISLKMFSELLIMLPVYRKFNYSNLILYFPLFQVYFAIYGLLLPFTFLLGYKIIWKDRKH